ncbi:MAG TPA: hypothetical protein PLA43_02205 [Bryobacteraceae bacterium]|nr:hypothetical protein [Bryobacteraceae bacterium]HOL71608.1 hypothetical protein [Bryobacteraceae bacterium]HOQ44422.1 hypothetical protein [Bryobacteraceae bacterium]HPU70741.1 hypothetical protein [Bryobacteraceae bacterium]
MNKVQRISLIAGVAGLALCLIGVIVNPAQFFRSYLWSWIFWLGLSIGCGQVLMLQFLITSRWGFLTRSILVSGLRVLPLMFLFVVPVIAGIPALYPFAMPDVVRESGALQWKAPYLNTTFWLVRVAAYFLIWWLIARLLCKWTDALDRTGDLEYVMKARALSGPGIIAYSLAMSFAAVDWAMALEPEWYSSIYPSFYLVGQALAAFALVIVALRYLAEDPPLSDHVTSKHFHDLGNLLFTFVILWAYLQTAQLIIIWAANLPREIIWYLNRTVGGWAWLTAALAVFHFFVPFFILLSRKAKQNARKLAVIAAFVFLMRLVDHFWLIAPAFYHDYEQGMVVSWLDFAAPVGLGGIWVAYFLQQLKSARLAPGHEFELEQSLQRA